MHVLLRRSSGQDPEQTRKLADLGRLAALKCAWLALACERHADAGELGYRKTEHASYVTDRHCYPTDLKTLLPLSQMSPDVPRCLQMPADGPRLPQEGRDVPKSSDLKPDSVHSAPGPKNTTAHSLGRQPKKRPMSKRQ